MGETQTTAPVIEGTCDPKFELVREAFARNFEVHGEVGAAVCVSVEGRTVVDLWGGVADAPGHKAWQPDTLVNVFSIGKGLTAACAARLVGEGRLGMDQPVARYWPEFGQEGKERITVAQVLSHQAGLPAIRRRLPDDAMLNWAAMTDALAEEEPWWEPGTAHGYHVNTYGYLIGEVIRRVSGRTPGAYLREEIAGPLGADVHIGLEATEDVRVARYLWPSGDRRSEAAQRFEGSTPIGDERPELEGDRLMVYHAYFNPRGASGTGVVNTREWRAAEIPSTNGHATARGVARVYQALANRGEVDGIRVVDAQALDEATREWSNGHDRVLDRPSRFGLGFQLTQPERPLGPGRNGFGHFGAGGSLGFCDPDAGLAFGYVMNQMGPNWQNPRNRGLIDAVYASLGAG